MLYYDELVGDNYEERVIRNPTLGDIEFRVRALNANEWTCLSVYGPEDMHMCIGGGNGNYLVYVATKDEEEIWNLPNPLSNSKDKVLFVAGGQEGDYEICNTVDLDLALRVIIRFCIDGDFLSEFN